MAYPTIPYDATSGSDTAPTGNDGSGTNGDWSSTTLTLNETVDFTGVADDDSDYLWVDTPNGSRHLAQITAFNPSVAACTTITTAESSTAAYTADNWAVNGTRKTFANDTSQHDPEDWVPGWTITLDGTFSQALCRPGHELAAETAGRGPLIIKAAAGATSRPVISNSATGQIIQGMTYCPIQVEGIKLSSTGGSTNNYVACSTDTTFVDCVFDVSDGSANYCVTLGSLTVNQFIRCYFTGAVLAVNDGSGFRSGISFHDCTVDGQGADYFATCGIYINGDQGGLTIHGCLIFDCDGDGILVNHPGTAFTGVTIRDCIIVDNTASGIGASGTAETSPGKVDVVNCIIAYNTSYGIEDSVSSGLVMWRCDSNAVYSNTSGQYNGLPTAGPNAITLTADPFTDRGANDYTLNDTAGGGALLKGAAYPATMPDGR